MGRSRAGEHGARVDVLLDRSLTEMFDHGDDEGVLLLNPCGPGRGGACIPGPLWASTSELAILGMPHLNQIIGHFAIAARKRWELMNDCAATV